MVSWTHWHGLSSPWVWDGPARPPSSVLRFFRLLRFFAANPPSSVLSHQPSASARYPPPFACCQIAFAAIRDYPSSAQGHSHRSPCPPRCGRRSDTSWLQSGTVCPSSRDQYQHAAKLGAKPAQTNRSGPRTTPHGEQASRDVTRSRCLTSWPQVNGLRALRVSSIASNTTFTPSRTGPRGSISRFCC